MSKTPISTLQEYMAKQSLDFPVYDLIAEKSGTHIPSFTYRVKCGTQSALGTATNKKEAKHNAAKQFLNNLQIGDTKNHQTAVDKTSSPSKITEINSYYEPRSDAVLPDDIFVNSIGKLSEHCTQHKLLAPQYEMKHRSGPSHMSIFTMICSIGILNAEATAPTKKQAKHGAAQNMLQILMKNSPVKKAIYKSSQISNCEEEVELKLQNSFNMLDLKIEQPKMPVFQSSELAKELFPKLRLRDSVKVVKNIEIKEYHRALRESIDPTVQETLRRELCAISGSTTQKVLRRIAKLLDTKIETTTLVNMHNGCAVSCKLDSIPVLTDVGVGITLSVATEKAMSNLLASIDSLFK